MGVLLSVLCGCPQGCWRTRYGALSPADCYSWPSVARGSNTLVVSPTGEQPLTYLPPLITNILLSSDFTCHTSSSGVRSSSSPLTDTSSGVRPHECLFMCWCPARGCPAVSRLEEGPAGV